MASLKHAELMLRLASTPVNRPNKATLKEFRALRHFVEANCANTPNLISHSTNFISRGIDEQAMAGGYAVFMLMNKLPGEPLDYKTLWSKDEQAREGIRHAFKEALMEVWWWCIRPCDCVLRNLIWDAQEQKCYIIDFEEYSFVPEPDLEKIWTEVQYEC